MKKLFVLFAALTLVFGFAATSMAVDWNFYGSARVSTWYDSVDFKDNAGVPVTNGYLSNPANNDKDAEFETKLQGNSRIGARVKAENLSGRVELGINESTVTSRLIFGVWKFGAGSFKVGKDYTPVSQFVSGQVFSADLGMLGTGTVYGGRHGQLALTFGNFTIAAIAPDTSGVLQSGETGAITTGDEDEWYPKLEASWGMAFDTWNFGLQAGFQGYQIEDAAVPTAADPNNTEDIDVYSWSIGATSSVNLGPVTLNGALSYASNPGDAGWSIPGGATPGAFAQWDGDDGTKDVGVFQGFFGAQFKFTDMLRFEAGVGYRQDDPDGDGDKAEAYGAYVNAVIALAPGVYIIPEVGMFDYGKNYADEKMGDEFYAGAKWQIDF